MAGVIAVLLVGVLLAGCAAVDSARGLPEGEPDIRGVVISHELSAEGYPGIRVVWTDDSSVGARADYDVAQVQADDQTLFFEKSGSEYVAVESLDKLVVGAVVEVWFTGAVRESYPVQATASSVAVAGRYDGELPSVPGLEP